MALSCANISEKNLVAVGLAKDFTGPVLGYGGIPAIENSLVTDAAGRIFGFFDPDASGALFSVSVDQNGRNTELPTQVGRGFRFSYVMRDALQYYLFALKNGDIHAWKSVDGQAWVEANGGRPVLTHSADSNSIYRHLWNVAVTVDDQGLWHLLVECATGNGKPEDQGGVGLAYSSARWTNDTISFDADRTTDHVIERGGNPDIKFLPGRGLLVLHGQLNDPTAELGSEWYITASTLRIGDAAFSTHKSKLALGYRGVHVCDPHILDVDSHNALMSYSHAQNSIHFVQTRRSLAELFDSLIAP